MAIEVQPRPPPYERPCLHEDQRLHNRLSPLECWKYDSNIEGVTLDELMREEAWDELRVVRYVYE